MPHAAVPPPHPAGILAPIPGPIQMAGVVVPIRSFVDAKRRLGSVLDGRARIDLVQAMAQRVIDAAAPHLVVVVSSAPEVVAWASTRALLVIDDERASLDGAAAAGRAFLARQGCTRVVIAHADLPRARSLDRVVTDITATEIAMVPCHRDDGTNVLSVPVGAEFRFSYGPGSFERHLAEARRVGLEVRLVHDPELMLDIDEPGDLEALRESMREGARRPPLHG